MYASSAGTGEPWSYRRSYSRLITWRSLLAAEQWQGEATTLRFLVVVGAGLLALILVGSIAAATMAEFWGNN